MPMDLNYWLGPLDALLGHLPKSIADPIAILLVIAGWLLPTIITVALGIKPYSWKFWLILFLNGPVAFVALGVVRQIMYPME